MLRWIIRIAIVVVVLIAVGAVIIHLILQSDWLAEMVLARVSRRLGLVVDSELFSVGWGGTTTLGQATVRMPLSDEVVFSADRVRLGHEIIPLLLFGRPFNVHLVEVDNPTVHLRRYEDGRWNAQDVWTRVRASLELRDRPRRRTRLPAVVIRDAQVRITEPNGAAQVVEPLAFRARRQGQARWAFDLEIPPIAGAEGRLIQEPDWAHEVGFAAEEVGPVLRSIFQRDVSPARIAGRWKGTVLQNTLSGTLQLDRFEGGQVVLQGEMYVEADPNRMVLAPRDLVLSEPNLMGQALHLAGGAVRFSRGQVIVEHLAVMNRTLAGQLNGQWDWRARAGELSGSWLATLDEESGHYHGTYKASVNSPRFGRKEAQVSMTGEAETLLGKWSIAAGARGEGADWQRSQWQVSIPRFFWARGERELDLSGTAADIGLEWPAVRLRSVHVPNAERTSGSAQLDVNTRRWSARLEVDNLRPLPAREPQEYDLRMAAAGDGRSATISELRVAEGARVVTAKGKVSFHERGLQDFRISADWPAGAARPEELQAQQPIGRWRLEADVTGRVYPIALEVEGTLAGQNISLGQRLVERVEIPVRVKGDARQVQIASQPFGLLGGQWQVSGQHGLSDQVTQVNIVADSLSLTAVASMAGLSLTSEGLAHAEIRVAVPGLQIQRATAAGSWSAEDIRSPHIEAQRARGRVRISEGLVRLEDIHLEQADGRVRAGVEFRLYEPQFMSVELEAQEWPVPLADRPLVALTDGQAKLHLNVVKRMASGEVRTSSRILWEDCDLARVRLSTLVRGRTLDMQEFYAETLGGAIKGKATIPLDRWIDSVAELQWQGIQPRLLARWVPQFERFEGTISGSLMVDQADEQARAPEPMRLALDADIQGGRFGPAQVDVSHIVGYLGTSRLLIDEASFQMLGGRLDARARVSTHADRYYSSVGVDFNDLNLDQLVHVIDPNAAEYAGRLSGNATILSSSGGLSLGGEARVNLTQSDIINNRAVATLYNALNLQFGPQQPTGTGEISIRFEGSSVMIPSFIYFNRGVEIRGAGEIADVSLGAESPVDGYAVASTRVLKGIALPGVKDLDRLLTTFQSGAASVKIGGTLDNVEVNVVPLPAVLDPFRQLLWAQLRQ